MENNKIIVYLLSSNAFYNILSNLRPDPTSKLSKSGRQNTHRGIAYPSPVGSRGYREDPTNSNSGRSECNLRLTLLKAPSSLFLSYHLMRNDKCRVIQFAQTQSSLSSCWTGKTGSRPNYVVSFRL